MTRQFAVALIVSAMLVACGGGGGGSGSSASQGTTVVGQQAASGVQTGTATETDTSSGSGTTTTVVPVVTLTAQPINVAVAVGSKATFAVQATTDTEDQPLSYQWYRNGTAISGATEATFSLTTTLNDSGSKFYAVVKSGSTSVTSSEAILSVVGQYATSYPIMFVTSVPSTGFNNPLNTFGNHGTLIADSIPGGDLYIRYSDGTLRNVTKEAGWGIASGSVQAGSKAIAVRNPSMHWDGKKAIFSMLVGGPARQFDVPTRRWQLYEVTGLAKGETAVITKVANQPTSYNNILPIDRKSVV